MGSGAGTASPFGTRLRRWRHHRGISQLTLAGQVGSTPRHISFLETGRSRPSRQMVLRLGEVLDVSLHERNELLAAVANWPEVAWAALGRLRQQRDRVPLDQELHELVALAETAVAGLPRPAVPGSDPVVCPWFRIGDQVIRVIGMAARFDPVADVTLDELRIELFYPLDETAESFFRGLGTPAG